jgi:hypothetical protein
MFETLTAAEIKAVFALIIGHADICKTVLLLVTMQNMCKGRKMKSEKEDFSFSVWLHCSICDNSLCNCF